VVREPRLTVTQALRSYIRFHAAIEPARSGFVLARFETVARDMAAVIEAVNRRFGTGFVVTPHTPEHDARVRAALDAHDAALGKADARRGRPTEARDAAKAALRSALDAGAARGARERAAEVYRRMV